LLEIAPLQSVIKIKALKTHILEYIPSDKMSILYLDVDIIITKPLHSFLYDIQITVSQVTIIYARENI
jgi:lipopolysaccharide biosynthesis glycosyltransferase